MTEPTTLFVQVLVNVQEISLGNSSVLTSTARGTSELEHSETWIVVGWFVVGVVAGVGGG